jgi:hypothetical protein
MGYFLKNFSRQKPAAALYLRKSLNITFGSVRHAGMTIRINGIFITFNSSLQSRDTIMPIPAIEGIGDNPWIPGRASLARNDVLVACSNQGFSNC